MGYKRIGWKDHVVQRPRTYRVEENSDGSKTMIPEPGAVLQQGTPQSARNFGMMDAGLQAVSVAFDELLTIVQAKMRELDELRDRLNAFIAASADITSVTYAKETAVNAEGKNVATVTYTVTTDARAISIQNSALDSDSYYSTVSDTEKYSTVSGSVRTWTLKRVYTNCSGTRTVKFRASTDGENYGNPYSISVDFD